VARGVSTVVDVSLALLLVSASVVVLVSTAPPPDGDGRDARTARTAATLLATTTAQVSYPGGTASGTVATLLADAAVAAPRAPALTDGATARANRTLRHVTDPAQVVARPLGDGRVVAAGSTPPRAADVTAVAFVVPAGQASEGTPVRIVVRTWSR